MSDLRRWSFSKDERILRTADYKKVLSRRRGLTTRHFRVYLRPVPTTKRLGLTVSRKVGGAVQRNGIKRRVREFFRLNKERLPQAEMVVIAFKGAAGLGYEAIADELSQVLLPSPEAGPRAF